MTNAKTQLIINIQWLISFFASPSCWYVSHCCFLKGLCVIIVFCWCVQGLWVLYMLNGYRAFPAAHKVLDLLQHLLSTSDAYDQQVMELELKYLLWCEREFYITCRSLSTDGDMEGGKRIAPHSHTLFRCSHHWYWSEYVLYVFAFLLLRALVSPV